MKQYISSHYGKCQKDTCECLKQHMNFEICPNWHKFTYENFEQMIENLPNIRNLMETQHEDKDR